MSLSQNPLKRKILATIFIASVIVVLSLIYLAPQHLLKARGCEEISCDKGKQSEDDYLSCIKEKQGCWEGKIKDSKNQAVTLQNTISIINGQIALQKLQIEQTVSEIQKLEGEVEVLSQRIDGLALSLDRLSELLIERVQQHYKRRAANLNLKLLLLKKQPVNDLVTQLQYLKKAEAQTAQAMQLAENQRLTYHEQKALKEAKQQELEQKKQVLQVQEQEFNQRKAEQHYLLTETQSNEARYQQELAKTLSELKAIQSIIAGRGDESKVGEVKQGDKVASIIAGASACSTGTHLHFEVVKDGAHRNPAGYLKSVGIDWNIAPTDPQFAFTGNWEWPVNNPARVTQGYGMTWYATVRRAYGGAPHTGIDITSKSGGDYTVKAVKEGTLYRGSIRCGGGYLRYVKLDHKEGGESTYYLHINY